MTSRTDPTADVLVIGAGPTGLLLAGDLAAAGVRVVLLERRARESNLTRAFAVHARALELLDARSIAEQLLATGVLVSSARLFGKARLDLSGLPSRFPGVLITPQYETERVLEERAVKLGVEIRRGTEVLGLRQDEDGVDVDVRTHTTDEPSGDASGSGGTATLRARYVVGADGVRSTVRQALGIPFPGKSVLRSIMLGDVRLAAPPREMPVFSNVAEGICLILPFGDGWYRIIAWERHSDVPADAPVELDDLRAITRAAFGTDFGAHDARWTSRFHSDERQVPRYRDGRVFLAGDAAHVHSPAGGMGMNAGMQDAANLSWKLAAVLAGRADDTLLDSYHDERHPVGAMVVRLSGAILRGAVTDSTVVRGLRRGAAVALRYVPRLTRRPALLVSGLGIRYPAPPGAHPLTGSRAPDLPLVEVPDGPTRLYEALRAGRYVRVLPRGAAPRDPVAERETDVVTVTRADARQQSLLVRPDGYVAWASDDGATGPVPMPTVGAVPLSRV
ncbi:FAD-dependent monooxygenase [Streptomyces syringium]|uniref:FAD-dependent monooxygenase n=1 Tax=Streptomyces syringium TaxID=76729 RepID=UPI00343C715D